MVTIVRKLPFWDTIFECHSLVLQNVGMLVRMFWPWLVALVTATATANWFYYPYYDTTEEKFNTIDFAATSIDTLVPMICITTIAVAWHRYILLSEAPSYVVNLKHWRFYRSYFLIGLLIFFASTLPIILSLYGADFLFDDADTLSETISTHTPDQSDDNPANNGNEQEYIEWSEEGALWAVSLLFPLLVLPIIALILVLIYVPTRLSLALPAAAIGATSGLIRHSWRISKGNFFRLFWGMIVTSWPVFFIGILTTLYLANHSNASRAEFVMLAVGTQVLSLIISIMYVSFLSIAYRHLATETNASNTSSS